MKPPIMQFCPTSWHFILLTFKDSPKHFVCKQPVLLLMRKTNSHTYI
jgi:hypothetical protein